MKLKTNSSAGRTVCRLGLLTLALASLSACTNQKLHQQTQANLASAQECIAAHQAQSAEHNQQQAQILAQLQQVQSQLETQQRALEARPQVVERLVPKADCPAPVDNSARKANAKDQGQTDKQVVGLREQTLIAGLNVVMNARINTNAANSVIDARNIQMFERNGEEWVRFTIFNPETKEP
ncbi:MAG TPA: RimK/LysX family protein, partial [Cellvibrio sp.]